MKAIIFENNKWNVYPITMHFSINSAYEALVKHGYLNNVYLFNDIYTSMFRIKKGNLQSIKREIKYSFAIQLLVQEKFGKTVLKELMPDVDVPYHTSLIVNLNPKINKHIIEKYKYFVHYSKLNNIFEKLDSQNVKKYMDWCCDLLKKGRLKDEDFSKTAELLKIFDLPKSKQTFKNDTELNFVKPFSIYDIENVNHLFSFLDNFDLLELKESRLELINQLKIYEDQNHTVCKIENHKQAIELSSGTNWCTGKKFK